MSSKMYGGGGGGGAHGRAMAWSGGGGVGSTKPPMVDNYLDSHGLNAGLGNAGAAKFPSVVESRPIQVAIVFTQGPFKIWLLKYNAILGCEDGELHPLLARRLVLLQHVALQQRGQRQEQLGEDQVGDISYHFN